MHPKKIENILKLNPFERYQYFIRKIADWEKTYTLVFPNGDHAISTIDDKTLFPLWSEIEFAEICRIDDWSDCEVLEIDFNRLEEIINFIRESDFLINVFPTNKTGFVVTLDEFIRDLKEELKNYE